MNRRVRHIALFIVACLAVTTGCVSEDDSPPENNTVANNTNNTKNTKNTNNIEEPEEVICDVVSVNPASLHFDVPEHQLEVGLRCDGELPADRFGQSVNYRGTRNRESTPLTVTSEECLEEQEFVDCTLLLEGLPAPTKSADENLGLETLVLEDNQGESLDVPVRWALSPTQVAALVSPRDLTSLPRPVAERAIDLRVRQTEGGRIIAGALRTEDGTGIQLFTLAAGKFTVHGTFAFEPEADNWGLELALTSDSAELDWWGFDLREGSFLGQSVVVDASGNVLVDEVLDFSTYSGPASPRCST